MISALILDDSPTRRRCFHRELVGLVRPHLFDRAGDALDWLKDNVPDVCFLDHDLHEYGTDIAESGSGMDVAKYLRQHASRFAPSTAVVVHSLNRLCGPAMVEMLKDIGFRVCHAPFCWEQPGTMARAVSGSLFPKAKKPVS